MSCPGCSCRKFGTLSSLCVGATRPHVSIILIVRSITQRKGMAVLCGLETVQVCNGAYKVDISKGFGDISIECGP